MNGALIVDKPQGPSSHEVVARVRRATGIKRIGHTGTLDPLATGVLLLLAGRATRLARFLGAGEKAYAATVRLGVATDTYDATGQPVSGGIPAGGGSPIAALDRAAIDAALESFRGVFRQGPPPFSAKKVSGVRAYKLARRRAPVALPPVMVTVHALELVAHEGTRLDLRLVSSPGFYVRSLAHDLGIRLGCGAHLEALRRTLTGGFRIEQAVALETIEAEGLDAVSRLIPMADLLPELPGLILTPRGVRRAAHGNAVEVAEVADRLDGAPTAVERAQGLVRLLDREGRLLAIAEPGTGPALHPVVVLV